MGLTETLEYLSGRGIRCEVRTEASTWLAAMVDDDGAKTAIVRDVTPGALAVKMAYEAGRTWPHLFRSPEAQGPASQAMPLPDYSKCVCCYIADDGKSCGNRAKWQIEEQGTTLTGTADGYTHACTQHVGLMLDYGGDPKVVNGKTVGVGYEVWPIGVV